jgi:hypothetical protein
MFHGGSFENFSPRETTLAVRLSLSVPTLSRGVHLGTLELFLASVAEALVDYMVD